jgi:hypothetical protein
VVLSVRAANPAQLRPSPAQAALFDETLETCRRLYNHALAERKTASTELSS